MKKITILIWFIIFSSTLFTQEGDLNFDEYQYDESIDFFNPNNVTNIPFFYPQNFTGGQIYFGLAEINSGRIDIAVALNSSDGIVSGNPTILNYYRKGTWNSNNGNGGFNAANNYYINETLPPNQNWNIVNGCVFVQLRDNESRKDLIVGRGMTNGLWVHWNNGSIGNFQQTVNANVTMIDKGKFDNSDNREDIIVKEGNLIKVFKNLGNGYLETTPFTPFTAAQNPDFSFKVKQMNDKDYDGGYWPANENDKADLIVLDPNDPTGPKLKVFTNSNSTTFVNAWTPVTIDPNAYNLQVADIDADGYNDVIVSVGFWGIKIYKNIQGSFLNPTPYWSYSNVTGNTKTTIADINKDGWNDLVSVEYERVAKVFLNKKTSPVFASIPDQTIINGHRENVTQIELVDIYNTGGFALISSDWMSHTDPIMIQNSLRVTNAINYNPAPQPAVIKGDLYYDNGVYRPRITINDTRRERDFYRYWIGKYNYTTQQQTAVPITTNTYIDYSEYVIPTDGIEAPAPNRWYSVIQMDLTSKWSPASNRVYFTVDVPTCLTCGVGDNRVSTEHESKPNTFSITNFPNPFNPNTKIYYNMPETGNVKITVYNSLGQFIKTLVNDIKGLGSHLVEFDGSGLSSGLYFYRIESGTYSETKKMLLLK